MNKRAERILRHLSLLLLAIALGSFSLCQAAHAAPAKTRAGVSVLVLPFQIHSEQDLSALQLDFPETLGKQLNAAGVKTIGHQAMLNLLESRKIESLDVKTVRSLLKGLGASHAVYGSINDTGNTMSIDARLVSADAGIQPRPIFVEQGGSSNIRQAAVRLAGEVKAETASVAATPTAAPSQVQGPGGRQQSVQTSGTGPVIAGVEVRGTKILDPEVVLMRINTRKGDRPDSVAIDQEVQSIWSLGYFSDVKVDMQQRADGLYLVYTVVEKPRVDNIAVEGTSALDEDDILDVMSTKAGAILNESLLAEDIQKILELYRKKGYYLAKVSHRIDGRQGGVSSALVMVIDEGKRLYVQNVIIEGASQLSPSDVKGELLLKERGMISWITGTGVLNEDLIERDSAAISSYYLDRGFLDVTVAAARVDYEEDGINVTFPIHEGPRYTLTGISFSGDLIDTDTRLRELTKTDEAAAEKEFFNLSKMQADTKKITDFYADYGYAFADVNPRPTKSSDGAPTVNIDYAIQKKNKVYVRRVLVEGNSKTRENVILREMRLTDGEQFEGSKLRRSSERLNKLGYFEVAEAELLPTPNDEEVDLKIKVKERPTGALMAGVGYSTFSSVGVSGTLMERNLFGKGYNVSLQAAFSGRRDAYTFSFTNPRYDDTNLSIGTDLYHWRDDYIDYTKKTTGGVLRFAYPLGEYTSVGWGYRLDQYELYDLDRDASEFIRRYATGTRYTSVGLGRIVRDTTNKERPTDGNIDVLAVEYGGGVLGGDDDFINLSAEHQTYYQLMPDHVLHARVKGSVLFENGSDEVPVFERFWMGGMQSVRGYNSRDLVPRDPETGDRIGGTRMAFANLEYIWSMSNDVGLNLVPFFDIGFNFDDDHDYNFSDEIKKSYGLELRWRSPMGDLRFSYGIPLDEDRDGDKGSGRFEFSMGQFF